MLVTRVPPRLVVFLESDPSRALSYHNFVYDFRAQEQIGFDALLVCDDADLKELGLREGVRVGQVGSSGLQLSGDRDLRQSASTSELHRWDLCYKGMPQFNQD